MGDHSFKNVLRGFFARHRETDISRSRVPVTSLCALISVAGKFDSHIALYLPPNGFVSFTRDFLGLAFMMIVLIVDAAILGIWLARGGARGSHAERAHC